MPEFSIKIQFWQFISKRLQLVHKSCRIQTGNSLLNSSIGNNKRFKHNNQYSNTSYDNYSTYSNICNSPLSSSQIDIMAQHEDSDDIIKIDSFTFTKKFKAHGCL